MSNSRQGGHRPGVDTDPHYQHSSSFRKRGPYGRTAQGGHRPEVDADRPYQHSSSFRKRGGYGRSSQDGGPGTSTPRLPPGENYRTRTGAANQDGTDFEIKMCALVFLRAVRSNSSFTMTSNDPRAGGFDDIVFSYGSTEHEQNILVQLKTSSSPLDLLTPKKKSLKYYFDSLKSTNSSQPFKNCTYVFLTNAGVIYKPRVTNVDSPAKKLLSTSWKPDDVFQVCLTDNVCKDFKDETGAGDFVKRLLIFRNQSGQEYLDELIKQELFKMCNGFVPEYRTIQHTFVEKIKSWWSKETKAALDENWKEWIELKRQLFSQNTLLKQIKFCDDTLSDVEKKVFGSKSFICLLKSDSTETQVACSKVYQTCIRKEDFRVIFTDISEPQGNLEILLNLCFNVACEVLVITDVTNVTDITNCCQNLKQNIEKYKEKMKKIIIVSNKDADKLGLSEAHELGPGFIKSTFNQLNEESQEDLKNIQVDFQGKTIALGSINAEKVLEGVILQDVLTSPKTQIGEALTKSDGEYIPRTLSKRLVVDTSILFSSDVFFIGGVDVGDLLELIMCKLDLLELGKDKPDCVENLEERWRLLDEWYEEQEHRFTTMPRNELHEAVRGFKCCAEKSPEGPVHFLEVIDKSFYWIHSHESTDMLLKYIEWFPREEDDCKKLIRDVRSWQAKEEDLVREDFRTVIVVDEPGNGKTSLLREVANIMKRLYPHRWVINIDLNRYSEMFKEMKQAGNVTNEYVFRLLRKAANLDDSKLGKELLKYYVSNSGHICLLFDAFDEIAPNYTETVLAILKLILKDFRLSALWIASRYNMKETLERELESKVFRIEPLSDKEQIEYISKLWGKEKDVDSHKTLLDKLPFHVRSSPLHLKMMCVMYADLERSDNFSRISTSFSVLKFYEQFIETKFDIYFKEKGSLNDASALVDDIKKRERKYFMKSHVMCSLHILDYTSDLPSSDRCNIERKVQKICRNILDGNYRFGIIDGVVDGKPHFLHRTFAEHFAGKWLAKHWTENKRLIRSRTYGWGFTHEVFCQELARELPAHTAVLNEDISALQGLTEMNVNEGDALGRTPLHLAVLSDRKRGLKMVPEVLKYHPNLEIKDRLFRYTPLELAVEMEVWDAVRILLKHGARVHWNFPFLFFVEQFVEVLKDVGRDGEMPKCWVERRWPHLTFET
ncbi:uncharacterized protein [Anabrus simplex]|uniref:uncharacterized protein n=1 Tax=Anabrus simplex TaxID=316456 RepID=UPI0035A3C4AB